MKYILFLSSRGDIAPIAKRVQDEGTKVCLYINDAIYSQVGDGIVSKVPISHSLIDRDGKVDKHIADALLFTRPDLVVFDMPFHRSGPFASWLGSKGIKVIGSSLLTDQLISDTGYRVKVMTVLGIDIPTPQIIDDVVEVTTEGWVSDGVVDSLTISLDEWNLMEGGIGPLCKGMGTISFPVNFDTKIISLGLKKIIPAIKKSNYYGPISLSCYVTSSRLYGITLRAAFKYNSIFTFMESIVGSITNFLFSFYSPKKSGYSMGTSIVVPPFPLVFPYNPILLGGINKDNLKHMWLSDVRKENSFYYCNGVTGDIGSVTAMGDSVKEARRRVYRTIGNLKIPNLMYRRDIGERFVEDVSKLKRWGWLS